MQRFAATFALACLTCSSAGAGEAPVKIGLLTDMSGVFADADGPGGAEAVKMAIEDFGGEVLGQKITFFSADHQNKPDIGAAKAREWFDRDGITMVLAGPNSSVALAVNAISRDKKRIFMPIGATTSRLSNEDCTPYTVQYAYDTIALSKGTGSAVLKQGGKSWYFVTADFAFGTAIEKDTRDVVQAQGGKTLGSVRHPLGTADYSSYLLQAQAARPDVLALANAGTDTINSIKAVDEFGLVDQMKVVAMNMYLSDVHALGLDAAKGMYMTDGWYWDLNDKTRAWAKRFLARTSKMPTLVQAADYSAAWHYLSAVKAAGSSDSDAVVAKMREMPINDFFATGGHIRADGRMIHEMYLMQVKSPSESKYPWDYYKVIEVIPGEQAAFTKEESRCNLWK
ncbi:ABC branched-chain amino acid family transporter, periplasmic ligand binding protein [Methylobacterium sp. 4-46]|uniref:ABC transporter substrate-binding protein n=1 Tax=unclassified Methylobacterium TaxID=2615210 RepID=UPI000165CAEC|nr:MULTISPECIES: ABC transporter substrate-binding protein [Methylobacterium]ACA19880.1 ABC branched-chain amino acid family transporter, periplasmic ligand binding protein [Methylobacterium sp. 4-46]WFT79063.1 ABC transporter substrate-binding protein [Methylobacterium nodulans]